MKKEKLTYIRGYEVGGVSPLPHYYEEIYGHIAGISKIGPRGDKNYFWYSIDGHGAAYYEAAEMSKSAKSTYKFFSVERNRQKYLSGVEKILREVESWVGKVDSLTLHDLTLKQLFTYCNKSWLLDARVFSYYLVGQPYRLQVFEDNLRYELKKRVAGSTIDAYLSKLTASEKMTKTTQEELEWAQLIIAARNKAKRKINAKTLEKNLALRRKILTHYDTYKILSLGDGNWKFDPQLEIHRFLNDVNKSLTVYKRRVEEIKSFSSDTLALRRRLIKELYLDDFTVEIIEFMAEMGHMRYRMRVEGFIPLIYTGGNVIDELAPRLGYAGESNYPFMTHIEVDQAQKRNGPVISLDEIKRRRGKHDEYMLRLNNGKIEYYYGAEARRLFKKLLPPVDHSKVLELQGAIAQTGEVRATVTVYRWGDDVGQAMKSIAKHPILVAGQTRPAMMQIIREAKGIVTDEGGVTSHAAIVARELKIPTIINTQNATKVLKTGDEVILDANTGLVKKVIS